MNSEFLLFTIETGWSVKIADGDAILINDNGTSIHFYEDHAVLEEPLKHNENGKTYTKLIAKFSKIHDIKWYVDEAHVRIEWSGPSKNHDCFIFVIFSTN